jgi:Flp pilus assembly protein CpaB
VASATFLRLAEKNIYADQPILKEYLKELAKPEPLHTRLLPRMRAINLSLPKEQTAGGLIQLGDWVDVLLTCTIERKDQGPTTRTACIIPHSRVVAKRNSLWPIYAPLPEDKPIQFTLETNPYRAALIEFARTRGQLSMTGLPQAEQQKLEAMREQILQHGDSETSPVLFGTPTSVELDEEETRVLAYSRGELAITEGDLTRIFNVTSPAPPLAPVTIERMQGIMRSETAYFSPGGTRLDPKSVTGGTKVAATPTRATADVRFSAPKDPNCKDCEAKRKKS